MEYFFFSFFFSFAGGGELLIYVTMTTDERDVHCLVGSTVCILYTLRWRKKKNFAVCVSRIDEHHVPFTNFHQENI